MQYQSPYDKLLSHVDSMDDYVNKYILQMEFTGSLDQILTNLEVDRTIDIILNAPRIIRAAIEAKIEQETEYESVKDAIEGALKIYQDPERRQPVISDLRKKLGSILGFVIHQKADVPTWHYSHPKASKETVSNIRDTDILLLALAHGGISAGMDIFLRHIDQKGSMNSDFYAVRCSRAKKGDKAPHLTLKEAEYLKSLAKGKQVILFDEDVSRGYTLNAAHAFFSNEVFPDQNIQVAANHVRRYSALSVPLI